MRSTVETAARIGIPWLTLYAFSEENWKKRPRSEVDFLMGLLCRYLKAEVPTLNKNNIRLEYIGRQHELPPSVQEKMAWAREATAGNTGMVLTLALNYSARTELVDAFRSIVDAAASNGGLDHLEIDEDAVSQNLYTRHLPDPDLVVRTSGEMRLSNFLLWQLAYAEIYVTPTLWPEFRGVHLLEGIAEYQKRERRYGGLAGDGPCAQLSSPPIEDGPELTRLATTETNPHRAGPDSHCSPAGFAGTGAGTGAGGGPGGIAGGPGTAENFGDLQGQALSLANLHFCRAFFLFLAVNPGHETPLLSTSVFAGSAAFVAAIAPFVFLVIGMRRADLGTAFPAAMTSAFAFTYIALPLGCLVQIREQASGAFLLLYLLLLVWAGDIFAYFVGRSLGRHLMSPRISPRKTWEGALASMLASVGVGMLLYNYALPISTALLNARLIDGKTACSPWRRRRCGRSFCFPQALISPPSWAIWWSR